MKRVKPLSTGRVKAIIKQGRPSRSCDGDGLYLVIDRGHSCYWMLRIKAGGQRHDYGLGSTRLVSLADAREKARAYRKTLMTGGDPIAAKKAPKATTPTFKQAADECLAEHFKGLKSEQHKTQWVNSLKEYVYPKLGKMPVDRIETRDVLNAITPIWQTKHETARRTLQRIGKVLHYSKLHGYRSGDNPVDVIVKGNGLSPQTRLTRHHAALPHKGVSEFVVTLRASTAELATKLAFELMVLTVCRTSEVVGARWVEIDWEKKVWTIPAARMKMKHPHVVPLSDRALEVLADAKKLGSEEYVFPSPKKRGRPLSACAFRNRIKYMGVANVTGHGFRSSFSTWANEETQFSPKAIERALAHRVRGIEGIYDRGDQRENRQRLMQVWADYITGRASCADNVVPMRAAQ
jgi:integrase